MRKESGRSNSVRDRMDDGTSYNKDEAINRNNCSSMATFFYLLAFGSQGAGDPRQLDAVVGSETHQQRRGLLWTGAGASATYLWCSACLWAGIWRVERRRLLPWLLITGVTLLLLVTAAVWLGITGGRGWSVGEAELAPVAATAAGRAAALAPALGALLLLYWWLLVNDLLEELHQDKKTEAEFVVSEKIAMTTAAAAAMAAATAAATAGAPAAATSRKDNDSSVSAIKREQTLV